jgi:UDP-N-acetylglucosamine 2-epimerase (non-hydrolysing)
MTTFEQTCLQEKPDWVIVVGDVNSTLACAITAKKLGICVAHVEAGLRSGDRSMPEEINRLCTDAITDLFFTTDNLASENLRREGVAESSIHMVGNTMIDTLLRHIDSARKLPLPEGLEPGGYAVVTMHRPSNVDVPETLLGMTRVIARIASRIPVVFPVHPRTRANLASFGCMEALQTGSNVRLLEPMSYLPFLGLAARSRFVLTDSGGIQEETTVLGVPCLTMRANTERPITCDLGTNILVGAEPARVLKTVESVLSGTQRSGRIPEKWDGKAAERIVGILLTTRGC